MPGRLVQGDVSEEWDVWRLPRQLCDACFKVRTTGQGGYARAGAERDSVSGGCQKQHSSAIKSRSPSRNFLVALQAWVMKVAGCSIGVTRVLRRLH